MIEASAAKPRTVETGIPSAQMLGSVEHVTGGWSYARFERASHWLQLNAPERVNELVAVFLREERPVGAAAPM